MPSPIQSINMNRFYKDLSTWIDQGCPTSNEWYFDTICGICGNLLIWGSIKDLSSQEMNRILDELNAQFLNEYPESEYPFNSTPAAYVDEENKFTNPWRLAWIKEHTPDIIEQNM